MAGKRIPNSSAFGPRSGWMPAKPAMLICLQVSDGIIREILEPHVVQDHEVPHRIVFIQATRSIGDLGHLSTLTLTQFAGFHTNDRVYAQTLHESDGECNALD